jgi:hypothetical protein
VQWLKGANIDVTINPGDSGRFNFLFPKNDLLYLPPGDFQIWESQILHQLAS